MHDGGLPGGVAGGIPDRQGDLIEGSLADGGGIALKIEILQGVGPGEAPGFDAGNSFGHGKGSGADAVEGAVAQFLDIGREMDGGQGGAVLKGTLADFRGVRPGHIHLSKTGAALEAPGTDDFGIAGNEQIVQREAIFKCALTDFQERFGEMDGFQPGAVFEGVVVDRIQLLGKLDFLQGAASIKSRLPDLFQAGFRQCHGLQIGQAHKGAFTNGRYTGLHHNRRDIADIAFPGADAGIVIILHIAGAADSQHTVNAQRPLGCAGPAGGNFRRGTVRQPCDFTAVLLHHRFGPGGILPGIENGGSRIMEQILAQDGSIPLENDLIQRIALLKGIGINEGDTGGNGDCLQLPAIREHIVTNTFHRVRDDHFLQHIAAAEGAVPDFGNTFRNFQEAQCVAFHKRALAQHLHTACKGHTG